MSALLDAKRFFWLGEASTDNPVELLHALVVQADGSRSDSRLLSENIKFKSRIAELETELHEARKKAAAHIELLQAQLDADHQHKRIADLETQLRESKAQTQAFRRAVVQRDSQIKK